MKRALRIAALLILALFTWFFLAVLAVHSFAQAPPEHENHDWLKDKKNGADLSCCSGGHSGDCQPVPFDSYTQDAKGGVQYGKWYFPRQNVFPTEDKLGRPVMCIWRGQPRCAFVPYSM